VAVVVIAIAGGAIAFYVLKGRHLGGGVFDVDTDDQEFGSGDAVPSLEGALGEGTGFANEFGANQDESIVGRIS
jgi:hypothetical protein